MPNVTEIGFAIGTPVAPSAGELFTTTGLVVSEAVPVVNILVKEEAMGFPAVSLAPLTVTIKVRDTGKAVSGRKPIIVPPGPNLIWPDTGVSSLPPTTPSGPRSVRVTVALNGSIISEKSKKILVLIGTPLAPLFGKIRLTSGAVISISIDVSKKC